MNQRTGLGCFPGHAGCSMNPMRVTPLKDKRTSEDRQTGDMISVCPKVDDRPTDILRRTSAEKRVHNPGHRWRF
jgi:hypothetical protein